MLDHMTSQTHPAKQKSDDLTLMKIMQRFSTKEAARDYLENLRWPSGQVCPHCGNCDRERVYKVTANAEKKIRAGLYKCAECREAFTVTMGTVMEDSHIPLNKWLVAFYIICASKTQVSALQINVSLSLVRIALRGSCAIASVSRWRTPRRATCSAAQLKQTKRM